MDFNINDPKNIIGISQLMEKTDDINIQELEQEIINGNMNILEQEDEDNVKQFQKDMERLKFEFNTDQIEQQNVTNTQFLHQETHQTQQDKYDFLSSPVKENIEDSQLKYMTMEEKKQNYVDAVLQDFDTNKEEIEFDMDKEREEDDKNALLDEIDSLKQTLEDDAVDISSIPHVDKNSSFQEIQTVYKVLRLKNDRNRYSSFAEEMILSMAYGLEYLFDGEKEWFGRKPDLVGWNQTLKIKLKRCRYQTSTLVRGVMQEYNMSPTIQLLMEIIPSMFLYSRQKKMANKDSLVQDIQYNEAISNLNSQFS